MFIEPDDSDHRKVSTITIVGLRFSIGEFASMEGNARLGGRVRMPDRSLHEYWHEMEKLPPALIRVGISSG